MNLMATIGVYAAILKARGEPLYYPGNGTSMLEITDTGIIAQCCEWALKTPQAKNQCFNIDNGEFLSMKEEWPVIASCFGMAVGEERLLSFRNHLPKLAGEWDKVRERYNLKAPDLNTFLGQSTQFSEFVFARDVTSPSSMSTIKVRRAGFNATIYSDDMFRKWFKAYQDEGLLPPV